MLYLHRGFSYFPPFFIDKVFTLTLIRWGFLFILILNNIYIIFEYTKTINKKI